MKERAKKGIDRMEKILDQLEKMSPEIGDIYESFGIVLADLADTIEANDAKKFLAEKRDCRNSLKAASRMFNNLTFKNTKKLHEDTSDKPNHKEPHGKKHEKSPLHSFASDVLRDPNEYEDDEHNR